MNGVDEGRDVRALLDSVLEGDTGPRYSPEEVLRSARKATAQRRAVVASALSVGVVLAAGAGVFTLTGPSTVESASGVVLTTTAQASGVVPGEVPAVPNTPEHAAELTAKLVAANVIPAGYEVTEAVGAQAGPMEFYRFGEDSSDGYKATAVFADAKGRATVTMFVQSASKHPECTAENNCVMGTPLQEPKPVQLTTRIVDGVELTLVRNPGPGPVSVQSVRAHLPNGTVVYAGVRNEVEVMSGGAPTTERPTRDSVPFTEEQLIDMVLKPGFHY